MTFEKFFESQKRPFQNTIGFDKGSPAYWNTVRMYNAFAALDPDKFPDLIIWERDASLVVGNNPDGFGEIKVIPNPHIKGNKWPDTLPSLDVDDKPKDEAKPVDPPKATETPQKPKADQKPKEPAKPKKEEKPKIIAEVF